MRRVILLGLLLSISACDGDAPEADAGARGPRDGGARLDGGSDAGPGADAGTAVDAGPDFDAGTLEAGPGSDAGTEDGGAPSLPSLRACPEGPMTDLDADGWSACQFDCADDDPLVHPGQPSCTGAPAVEGLDAPYYEDFDDAAFDALMPLSSRVIHVSPSGDDATGDGSVVLPFRSLTRGVEALRAGLPGDDMLVEPGTYEPVRIDGLAGTADNPTVIRGRYAPHLGQDLARYITIDAAAGTRHSSDGYRAPTGFLNAGIVVEDVEHTRVGGFSVRTSRGHGVYAEGNQSLSLIGLHTFNTGQSGVFAASSSDLNVFFNRVEQAVQIGFHECLTLSRTHRFSVIGNLVRDREKGTPSLQADYIQEAALGDRPVLARLSATGLSSSACVGSDAWRTDATAITTVASCVDGGEGLDVKGPSTFGVVAFNTLTNLRGKLALYFDAWGLDEAGDAANQEHLEVHHNLVYRSGGSLALSVENGASDRGALQRLEIHHNVFLDNEAGLFMGDHGGRCNPTLDGCTCTGVACDSTRTDYQRLVRDLVIRNNLFVRSSGASMVFANPHASGIEVTRNLLVESCLPGLRLGNAIADLPPDEEASVIAGYVVHENVLDPESIGGALSDFPTNTTAPVSFGDLDACDLTRAAGAVPATAGLLTGGADEPMSDAMLQTLRDLCEGRVQSCD
ncbi:MAG: hypothetical protein AB8I08_24125 [Sandaracinaceae bacterium]